MPITEQEIGFAAMKELARHVDDIGRWRVTAFDILRWWGGDATNWYFLAHVQRFTIDSRDSIKTTEVQIPVSFSGVAERLYEFPPLSRELILHWMTTSRHTPSRWPLFPKLH